MPKFDGTGPIGMGRMTGRGKGKCSRERSEFEFLDKLIEDVIREGTIKDLISYKTHLLNIIEQLDIEIKRD